MLFKAKQWEQAQQDYRQAIALAHPGNGAAHAGLADCLAEKGSKNEALEEYEKAMELDPEIICSVLKKRRELFCAMGNFEAALRDNEKVSFMRLLISR